MLTGSGIGILFSALHFEYWEMTLICEGIVPPDFIIIIFDH